MYRVTVTSGTEQDRIVTSRTKSADKAIEKAKQAARDYSLFRYAACAEVLIYNEPIRSWIPIHFFNAVQGELTA